MKWTLVFAIVGHLGLILYLLLMRLPAISPIEVAILVASVLSLGNGVRMYLRL